jgi:hypothetical protein
MTKLFLLVFSLHFSMTSLAQLKIQATNQFTITDKGKTRFIFHVNQYKAFTENNLGDVVMFSSKGEEKAPRRNVKAILLRDIVGKVDFTFSKMKELNEFYFFLQASDGYKVVLSRNEVFNTNNLYIITASNGIRIEDSPDRIEVLALSETGKGHILMKGLRKLSILKMGG